MVINGAEFDFNPLNANDMERYETALDRFQQAADEDKAKNGRKGSQIIREQCCIIAAFINDFLGEGASEKLGLNVNDIGTSMQLCGQIIDTINNKLEFLPKQLLNREQRRNHNKRNRK